MELKRKKMAPVRFADEYAGCEVGIDDYFEAFRGDKVQKRDMYFSEILQNLYIDGHLPFRAPLAPTEDELAEMNRVSPGQPHPFLFTWATKAKIDTNMVDVTLFVLLSEGKTKIRSRLRQKKEILDGHGDGVAPKYRLVGGESRADWTFYLNNELECLIRREHLVGSVGMDPTISRDMCSKIEARQAIRHGLAQLHARLRDIVSCVTPSVGNDFDSRISAAVPLSVILYLLPGATVYQQGRGDGGVVNPVLTVHLAGIKDSEGAVVPPLHTLDKLFPPTEEDIASNNTTHPFYGHSTMQRWWCHYKDAVNTARDDGNPEDAFRYKVCDSPRVVYNLRKGEVSLDGLFKVSIKKYQPDRDGPDFEWRVL